MSAIHSDTSLQWTPGSHGTHAQQEDRKHLLRSKPSILLECSKGVVMRQKDEKKSVEDVLPSQPNYKILQVKGKKGSLCCVWLGYTH